MEISISFNVVVKTIFMTMGHSPNRLEQQIVEYHIQLKIKYGRQGLRVKYDSP